MHGPSRRWISLALVTALGLGSASALVAAPPTKATGFREEPAKRAHGLLANWSSPQAAQPQANMSVSDLASPPLDVIEPVGAGLPCDDCVPEPHTDCIAPLWRHRNGVFAEALFLRPGNVDVIYAIEQTGPLVTDSPTGPVGRVGLDNEMGFRVGFSHAMSECSSIVATYTWFDADTSDFITATPGTVLALNVGSPTVANVGATSIESGADYRISFQQVDLDYRSLLYGSQNSAVNYFAGVRYANLDQEFTAAQVTGVATGLTTVATDIDFDGFGIGFGLDGEKRSQYSGLLVYGKASASFVSGEFKASFAQANQFGAAPPIRNEFEDYRVVSILQTELGLGWMSQSGRLRITGGYQYAGWFNSLTTGTYIEGIQEGEFAELQETLTFDGLVSRVEWRF